MKKIFIIIGIVILAVIVSVLLKKTNLLREVSNASTFTHSSGAFSFKYPSDLVVLEKDSTVAIAQSIDSIAPIAGFNILYYPDYISKFSKDERLTVKTITIDGYKTYIVSSKQHPQVGSQYFISLDDTENPSTFLAVSLSPNTVGFSQEQFNKLVGTVSIDKEKIDILVQNTVAEMKAKALEAKLRATLSSVRPSAELYYDSKKSYDNVCKPVGDSQSEKLLKDQYKSITDDIGENNITCFAKKNMYAVSIKTPKEIWCIDSTGFNGAVASMVKGYSCK